ncbi:hypothetical protein [Alteromonas macleodii]|jgi:hypothetical protein|uniref:hypothetical protein n=1 Tax=Alteromonas macleodii TaxID=28108 RepID=UPI00313B345A
MNLVEKSSLKFKREIKKARLMKQREIAHQQSRFTTFFKRKTSFEQEVHLITYDDGEAFKRSLSNDVRNFIGLYSESSKFNEFRFAGLQELREAAIFAENETVFLFSNHDYSFPSVLIPIDEFFGDFASILDLMENEVTVLFSNMKSAASINNEEPVIKVKLSSDCPPI